MSVFIIRFASNYFLLLLLIWFLLTRKVEKKIILKKLLVYFNCLHYAFGLVLVVFRFIQFGEEPGGKYIPPKLTEEGIEPGHVER